MWYYDFDLWPWITIGIFLSCWSSCNILEISVQSVSCLQRILLRFPTMWQYDIELWPPTLKNDKHIPLIIVTIRPWPPMLKTMGIFLSSCWLNVPSCMILELMVQSESCYNVSRHVFLLLYVIIRPWPLTLKNNRHLSQVVRTGKSRPGNRGTEWRATLYHNQTGE